MKLVHDQAFTFNPNIYMQFRFALSCFPSICNITGESSVGNSSGFDEKTIKSSLGEYLERYHFYNEIHPDCRAKISEHNPPPIQSKLIHLINQLKQTTLPVEQHDFELCKVRNVFTNKIFYLPLAMISLSHGHSPDRQYVPFVDSCGQSAHVDDVQAFNGAISEFIERQALVGGWLSGRIQFEIALCGHKKLNSFSHTIAQLSKHGNLFAFNLGNYLPGYSVVVFYFSKNKLDKVHYAVGMATDFLPEVALKKAINELWQSYIFMYLNAENPENLDRRFKYLNELIEFNSQHTKNIIPFFSTKYDVVDMEDYLDFPRVDERQIMHSLGNISTDIYAYENNYKVLGKKIFFCKIISPDFFLHMGIKMPLNLDNPYAKLLNINPAIAISQPIPFP